MLVISIGDDEAPPPYWADIFDDSDLEEAASKPVEKKPKKSDASKHFRPALMERADEEVRGMMASGEWDGATARHFVALYELLHDAVYGVRPSLSSTDRAKAALFAGKILREQFGSTVDDMSPQKRMAIFMSWSWTRERKQQAWREAHGRDAGRRLGWQLQFSRGLVDDYRVDDARMRARHK